MKADQFQRFMNDKVFTDNVSVTYTLVARHFNVPVSDSKKALYSFFQDNKDKCKAVYIVTGSQGDKTVVSFTEDLNKKDEFDSVSSVQIYSLQGKENQITLDNTITSTNHELLSKVDLQEANWISIKGPKAVLAKRSAQQLEQPQTKSQKLSSGLSTLHESRKKGTASVSLMSSDSKELKARAEQSTEPKAEPKRLYQYVSRKKQIKKPTPPLETKPQAKQFKQVKKMDSDLQALFDDDDDDFDDKSFTQEDTPVEVVISEKISSAQAEKPDDGGAKGRGSTGSGKTTSSTKSAKTAVPELDKSATPATQQEIDEDDYIVTRKLPNLTNKKAPKSKKQSSLMSFFGKR